MRIAYVTIHVAPEIMHGGVGQKIKTQMEIWTENGHDVVLFCLTPAEIKIPNIKQFTFNAKLNTLQREIQRSKTLSRMLKAIQSYQPDLIYLRYGLYAYPLHHIFKIAPVVVEINSNDIDEYRSRGLFFYWLNRFTRNLTLKSACGYIVSTYELVKVLNLNPKIPTQVISNGVNLKNVYAFPPTNHIHPVITLIGSPGMNWHGVDKLLQLAKLYPKLVINIVGYSASDIDGIVPNNVNLHGFLDRKEILQVLAETDVACGTLALHRKNMEEASPLKVRESIACGIPVILGYKDTDLDDVKIKTILRLPNSEDNVMVHAKEIHQFAYAMIGNRLNFAEVAPYLDQHKKETSRLSFFMNILENIN